MGTAPANFPPDGLMQIGQIATGNKLALSATLALTTFFTAPFAGLYLIAAAVQIISTDAAGTLVTIVRTPAAGDLAFTAEALTVGPVDGYLAATPVWLDAGETVKVQATAAGLTGTVYNVFVTAQRAF